MMTWLRKHNKEIMLMTFATFLIGGVAFTGAQTFALSPFSPVLVVNGTKVPYKRYQTILNQRILQEQQAEKSTPMTPDKMAELKNAVLQGLTQETAFLQEADRYGIAATDGEVAAVLHGAPVFQRDGRFDQALYLTYVTQGLRVTPEVFEEEQRLAIRRQKLMMLLSGFIKVSDSETRHHMARLPAKERKMLEAEPEKARQMIGQEQGNAAFQTWFQQVSSKIKVENRLDRWEKQES